MTPFQKHRASWESCTRCPLHEKRHKVVLLRGSVPAKVLFVGEAPGQSEDAIGIPFIGPAGKLLDKILLKSVPVEVTYALTNLVGCIPFEEDEEGSVSKATEPPIEAIKACRPRLVDIARIVKPRLIVCVGKLSGKHLLQDGNEFDQIKVVEITHPAFVLRSQPTAQPLLIQRMIVTIRSAVEEVMS